MKSGQVLNPAPQNKTAMPTKDMTALNFIHCVPDKELIVVFRCELHLRGELLPVMRIEDPGFVLLLQQTDFPD